MQEQQKFLGLKSPTFGKYKYKYKGSLLTRLTLRVHDEDRPVWGSSTWYFINIFLWIEGWGSLLCHKVTRMWTKYLTLCFWQFSWILQKKCHFRPIWKFDLWTFNFFVLSLCAANNCKMKSKYSGLLKIICWEEI